MNHPSEATQTPIEIQLSTLRTTLGDDLVQDLADSVAPNTWRAYRSDLGDFATWVAYTGAEWRAPESLARIELGAQGGALLERVTTTRTSKSGVGESRKWPSHALCGAFLAGFRVRTPQSAWHAPEDLSRASERIRRISRQMCRNRLLPVWVRFGVEALVRQL